MKFLVLLAVLLLSDLASAHAASVDSMSHGSAYPTEAFETMTWLVNDGRPMLAGDVFLTR